MKAYVFPVAPNPTRLRLYIAEKASAGCPIDIEEVMVSLPQGAHKSPEHIARNPAGRIPVLELDDGSHLTESAAIIEYLEERYPEAPMIGADASDRARVRESDRIVDIGVLMPIARLVHATRSPLGRPPNPQVAEAARDQLEDSLTLLEQRLSDGRPFVAGERVSVADCTLAAAFQFGRFREIGIDDRFEYVQAWDAAYRKRPAAEQVLVV